MLTRKYGRQVFLFCPTNDPFHSWYQSSSVPLNHRACCKLPECTSPPYYNEMASPRSLGAIPYLQAAAELCDFGQAYSTLKNRLIAGVRDNIREKLLHQAQGLDYFNTRDFFLQLDANRQQAQALARAANVYAIRHQGPSPMFSRSKGSSPQRHREQRFQTQRAPSTTANSSSSRQSPGQNSQSTQPECWRCGRHHNPATCPARGWKCYTCQQSGHTSRKCVRRPVHQANAFIQHSTNHDGDDSASVDRFVTNVFNSAFPNPATASNRADLNAPVHIMSDKFQIQCSSHFKLRFVRQWLVFP